MKKYLLAPAIGLILLTQVFASCNSLETPTSDKKDKETEVIMSTLTTVVSYTEATKSAGITALSDAEDKTTVTSFSLTSGNNEITISSRINNENTPEEVHEMQTKATDKNAVTTDEPIITTSVTEPFQTMITELIQADPPIADIEINENGELVLPEVLF